MNAEDNPLFFEKNQLNQELHGVDDYEKAAADWEFGFPTRAATQPNRRPNPIEEENDRMKKVAHA